MFSDGHIEMFIQKRKEADKSLVFMDCQGSLNPDAFKNVLNLTNILFITIHADDLETSKTELKAVTKQVRQKD